LLGCNAFTQRGVRFEGIYLASKSHYQLELIFQGIWDIGKESMVKIYKVAKICPLSNSGLPILFSITSGKEQKSIIMSDDASIPKQEWEWRTYEQVFQEGLLKAGFKTIDYSELKSIVRVLESGDAVFKGQVKNITVARAEYKGRYQFNQTKPLNQWIKSSELAPCKIDKGILGLICSTSVTRF
jgi:hypothetical protein